VEVIEVYACTKCGFDALSEIHDRFLVKWQGEVNNDHIPTSVRPGEAYVYPVYAAHPERLAHTCPRCGFIQYTPCADAES
jgi:predicted RNA-binding Zn-ribbon protein involved in translation (DUF1610 family)